MAKFKHNKDKAVPVYGSKTKVEPGKAFEIKSPHLIEKARSNPDFEEVEPKK